MNSRAQYETSADLTQAILSKLAAEKGVHAETAASVSARMAGVLLLGSRRLPLANLKPGSLGFSDRVNRLGPRVLESVRKTPF